MRGRILQLMETGILILVAGCVTGAGLAADLPQARPLPMIHSLTDLETPPEQLPIPDGVITVRPPDGPGIAREPRPRWNARLDAALLRITPGTNWYLFFPLLAF